MNKKPDWLSRKIVPGERSRMRELLKGLPLHTICEEALCPNIAECYAKKQATFLILGTVCTRRCTFCNVEKKTPVKPDIAEPWWIAEAVKRLGLKYAVITSPTRDDLADGGAEHYSKTVKAVKSLNPGVTIELLIPDFQGNEDAIRTTAESGSKVIGHNVETVPSLYSIRKGADYHRSLKVLSILAGYPNIKTKSGIMLGLGEKPEEVHKVMLDLKNSGCAFLSLGQYLAPSLNHTPVIDYIPPEKFDQYRKDALSIGFEFVESGPYVRSSYHAENYLSKS